MQKRMILILLTSCMVLSVAMVGGNRQEEVVTARIERVQRGDVHQVVAIIGRLRYAQESYIYATQSGVVERICVASGQRVVEGDLLVSLNSTDRDMAVAALYEKAPEEAVYALAEYVQNPPFIGETTVRSQKTCTIRQVLIQEGTPVAAGTPIIRTSSHHQEIVCSVSSADAMRIKTGMWAWLSSGGEALGTAVVQEVGDELVDATTGMRGRQVVLHPERHIALPEGASIEVDVYLAGSDDVLSLPVEAVTDRQTVWWVNEGRCTEIPAQIVLSDEMRVWVDLPEGLTVAIGEFKEGQRISEAEE